MMIPTRRQFIIALFGSAVGATVAARLDLVAGIGASDAPLVRAVNGGNVFAQAVVDEAWRLFQQTARDAGHEFQTALNKEHAFSERTVEGLSFRHMFGIDMLSLRFGDGEPIPYLEGVMRQLVLTAQEKGVGVYGRLCLPRYEFGAAESGPLRFVQAWDPVQSSTITRFDLLGASTEANLRTANRIRGERTKARLMEARYQRARFREGMMFSIPPPPLVTFS